MSKITLDSFHFVVLVKSEVRLIENKNYCKYFGVKLLILQVSVSNTIMSAKEFQM